MPVEIAGVELASTRTVTAAELKIGVPILLGGVVALLLKRQTIVHGDQPDFGLIGKSSAINLVRHHLNTVAAVDTPVLIRGESGTGKELIARAIHQASRRANCAYEALNMAAISPSLAGSELFGHKKGAFTGAQQDRDGCFTRARGGTLFLDEVGDTPQEVQPQLLRVLETKDYRPLGGHANLHADVRLIAATDARLENAIAKGEFREALLQRLAGFQIHVPALRARLEDLGLLVYHFVETELETLGSRERLVFEEAGLPWLSARTVAQLALHRWPGNVRQLRNVCSQIVIAGRNEKQTMFGATLQRLLEPAGAGATTESWAVAETSPKMRPADPTTASKKEPPSDSVGYKHPSEISSEELLRVLRQHDFRLAPTAKALGLSRTTLYAMIEASGAVRKASSLSKLEVEEAMHSTQNDLIAAARMLEVSVHALKLRLKALRDES